MFYSHAFYLAKYFSRDIQNNNISKNVFRYTSELKLVRVHGSEGGIYTFSASHDYASVNKSFFVHVNCELKWKAMTQVSSLPFPISVVPSWLPVLYIPVTPALLSFPIRQADDRFSGGTGWWTGEVCCIRLPCSKNILVLLWTTTHSVRFKRDY